jgi:hypothetical protein
VQDVLGASHDDGVAGVVSALAAYDDFRGLCKEIDYFAFAFIAPLGAYEDGVGHGREIKFG